MNKVKCKKCGNVFTGRKERKYCSRDCHHNDRPPAWNKGKKGLIANRKKEGFNRECIRCGKDFYIQKSRAGAKTAKFCSMSCYHSERWNPEKKCIVCNKKSEKRFCSKKCNNKEISRQKRNYYWTKKLNLIKDLGGKCELCGQDDIRVLDIDHINPETKIRPQNREYTWSRRFNDWESNKGNLRLLCSNCHRIHTWTQMGFGKDIIL